MKHKVQQYNRSGYPISEEIELPEFACFYKCNEFVSDNIEYATYSVLIDYSKRDYLKLHRHSFTFIYLLTPINKMIVILKDCCFLNFEPYLMMQPFKVDNFYLQCDYIYNGVSDTKEMYKLLTFLGDRFEVIKVRYKDPYTDQEIPSISKEFISLPELFHDQYELCVKEVDNIYTKFTSEKMFKYFLNFVSALIGNIFDDKTKEN